MNTANETSIIAYHKKAPKLSERRRQVLGVIVKYGPITNRGILETLQNTTSEFWAINMITGRCVELRNQGLVEHAGYTVDDLSGCKVNLWRAVPEPTEPQLRLL